MSKKKSTPITMEMFEEAILPRIEEVFDRKIEKYREEVIDFKVEVVGEIKDLREENQIILKQYERTNDKVDKIAKQIDISI